MIYEPKPCLICGKVFTPKRRSDILCGDPVCKYKRHRQKVEQYQPTYNAARRKKREEARMIKERRKPKQDTIVAIGYAERQKAETLKMAGRVNTEL